jgi:hypothetical protein
MTTIVFSYERLVMAMCHDGVFAYGFFDHSFPRFVCTCYDLGYLMFFSSHGIVYGLCSSFWNANGSGMKKRGNV